MKYAILRNDIVENIIVADEKQKAELEESLGAELAEVTAINLRIGDLREGNKWKRNENGEQVELTGMPTYSELTEKVTKLMETLAALGVDVDA